MKLSFSQRIGIEPVTKPIQLKDMDKDLRVTLWNVLSLTHLDDFQGEQLDMHGTRFSDNVLGSNKEDLLKRLWMCSFKSPYDTIPNHWWECKKLLKETFFKMKWHQVFDLMEFFAEEGNFVKKDLFRDRCNDALERENSAYRLIDGLFTPISNEQEVASITLAMGRDDSFKPVRTHLAAAIKLLSDRDSPDYRNSIKESISAVESLCARLTGMEKASLPDALRLMSKNSPIHGAFQKALTSLYAYTSDASGIRHALLEEPTLTHAEAKFMLVACSAFVNYAIESYAMNRQG